MKKSEKRQPKTLYFDYAATAPILKSALKAMNSAYGTDFGNPGAVHYAGRNSILLLDGARGKIAEIMGGEFNGTIFTSSATEANNLILKGLVKKYVRRERTGNISLPARIIISAAEHESVEQVAEKLSEEGTEVIRLSVKKDGRVDLSKLRDALNERTVIVSLIFTNNETGAVNDIRKAAEIIAEKRGDGQYPALHTDASQAFQYEDCSFGATNADAITLSSHKIGGPKGVGALVFRASKSVKLMESAMQGGGQEFGIRSGTENVPAIAGFAEAIKETDVLRIKERKRVYALKTALVKEIIRVLPEVKINGPSLREGSPHILNLWFPKKSAEEIVTAMDMEGIAVSYGSACSARVFRPSKAIIALGHSENRARESIRISSGRETKAQDIRKFARVIKKIATQV
ncbi:MAG: cysteine desulfurase family protein [Parcubacteria group bacterium]